MKGSAKCCPAMTRPARLCADDSRGICFALETNKNVSGTDPPCTALQKDKARPGVPAWMGGPLPQPAASQRSLPSKMSGNLCQNPNNFLNIILHLGWRIFKCYKTRSSAILWQIERKTLCSKLTSLDLYRLKWYCAYFPQNVSGERTEIKRMLGASDVAPLQPPP